VACYCIVLADIGIDVVVTRASFFDGSGACGQTLLVVPSGVAPSLRCETPARRWPRLAGSRLVVHDFAIVEIPPLHQLRTIVDSGTCRWTGNCVAGCREELLRATSAKMSWRTPPGT
jgi:hypothetical protein